MRPPSGCSLFLAAPVATLRNLGPRYSLALDGGGFMAAREKVARVSRGLSLRAIAGSGMA